MYTCMKRIYIYIYIYTNALEKDRVRAFFRDRTNMWLPLFKGMNVECQTYPSI